VDLVLVVEEKHNIECPTLMLWLLMRFVIWPKARQFTLSIWWLLLTAVLEEGDERTLKRNHYLYWLWWSCNINKSPLAIVNVAADFVPTRKHARVQKTLLLLGFRFCSMGYVAYLPNRATWPTYWFLETVVQDGTSLRSPTKCVKWSHFTANRTRQASQTHHTQTEKRETPRRPKVVTLFLTILVHQKASKSDTRNHFLEPFSTT
jgi:hypothetical protein